MIKFRIITDSSCGISQEEAKNLGVVVLPLTLTLNGKDYKDGIDISTDDFYNLLFSDENKDFPKTSMVAPLAFKEEMEKAINNGEIPLILPISSVLSGTYQSAVIAKDMLENDDVIVIDSQTALGSVKIMILDLVSKQFESKEELINYVEYLKKHVNFYAVPDTLEYLYRGGRLSKTTAVIGNLLKLKPVIQLNNTGKLEQIATSRGLKHAFLKIVDEIKEEPIDFDHPLEFGYSNHEENVLLLKDYLKDIVPNETKLCQISPVVGAHVGPGASAFFYISKNEVKKEKESILAKIKRKINS